MAIFLADIKPMRLYKTKFYLPIDKTDRKNNALVFLLTKNLDQSLKLMKNPMFINIHSYMSYYIESDITLFLNEDSLEFANNPKLMTVYKIVSVERCC